MGLRFDARQGKILTDATAIDFDQPVTFPAADTTATSMNIPHGTAPSAPTDGDVWTTTSGMYVRVNGGTVGPLAAGGGGVSASGTPVNNQLAVWTNATTIEGDANLTWTGTSLAVYGDQTASIIDAQDETFYDNSPTTEGTFSGGTGYAAAEVITLSDGSTITVDAVSTGVVTQFTVETPTVTPFVFGSTLTTTSSTGAGNNDFTLTPDADNVTFTTTTHHLGTNATNRLSFESGANYGRVQITDDGIDAGACNLWFDLNSSTTGNHSFYWSDGGFGAAKVVWVMDENVYRFDGGLEMIERADHGSTNILGGRGQLWVKSSGGGGELMYSEGDWDVDYTVQNMMQASYRFDTATDATDPGAGDIKFNNATAGSVTNIYINDAESTGRDNDFMLGLISDGDLIKIRGPGISAGTPVWWIGTVNGTPTDNTGWWTIPVTHVGNSGSVFNSAYPVQIDIDFLSQSPPTSSNFTTDSATTNADIPVITLRATSTGTPAAGIGPSIEFESETSAGSPGNIEIGGLIALEATDVTSTSEDFDFVFQLMSAGAAASEVGRITSTGSVRLNEKASADSNVAGTGQLWIENTTPSRLVFTNDLGTNYYLGSIEGDTNDAGSTTLATTSFVAVLNIAPDVNTNYLFMAAFEVEAPAADDVKIELVLPNTVSFIGTLTESETGTVSSLYGSTTDVVTNTVVVPTSGGTGGGNGTAVSIVGSITVGATTGTMSIRAAKNADTGADGFFRLDGGMVVVPTTG